MLRWTAVAAVVLVAVSASVLAYRHFHPPDPAFTVRSGVACADRYALALVDPNPVNGAWACLSDSLKATWADLGIAQSSGLAGWARQSPAQSLTFLGFAHHVRAGTDPSLLMTNPADLPPNVWASLYEPWFVYRADGTPDGRELLFVQMNEPLHDQVVAGDFGYCSTGYYNSIDCPANLSNLVRQESEVQMPAKPA